MIDISFVFIIEVLLCIHVSRKHMLMYVPDLVEEVTSLYDKSAIHDSQCCMPTPECLTITFSKGHNDVVISIKHVSFPAEPDALPMPPLCIIHECVPSSAVPATMPLPSTQATSVHVLTRSCPTCLTHVSVCIIIATNVSHAFLITLVCIDLPIALLMPLVILIP